ncbi:hypothetical protein [Butyrivibrio sp. INlla21]|uniref:hypothetical protein n=1 Tax=Butyrivibrio sp. INlla21 TaxID=1520811 RepID=UPI0008F2A087|nr:hypothetical protein [Butyrivibrio sp. INlla21]SFU57710.1 hypothetical protein SAMN02910342_00961 [Butyrivibrio sp. INlla21]
MMMGTALEIVSFLMGQDKQKLWDIEEHKEKKRRSLSSNSYYWKLLEELTIVTHVPKMKIHNLYLRQVGQTERVGDKPIFMLLPDDDATEEQVLLASTYHLAPRRETKQGTDGKTYRWYVMLRGSSTFSVEEMNMLVDLAVQDAKAQGIETLTFDELARIRELELANEQKNKGNINTTSS